MRKILLLIALCFCFVANAQSIMGIPLGSSKAEVTNQLRSRGYHVKDEAHKIEIQNVGLGGYDFDFATFFFRFNGDCSYLTHAEFSSGFELDDLDSAVNRCVELRDKYFAKYGEYRESQEAKEAGAIFFLFGAAVDATKHRLGITLGIYRADGIDGIERVYLNVAYIDTLLYYNNDDI